ncbi:hypothetical protein BDF20DRAFT_887122 [Mycotypha africana]|uniref:uncharacterized protein n=1 Tax=Mycotypha africana TaxID=64632 RepID=UPI0023000C1D|nr:uncharacterized protein BDF20DRAFT_887122 [Mycotypha africana]KAI8971900.1 hypothetical protein BDF20DRAFT_887122 [Mycotypha africana]
MTFWTISIPETPSANFVLVKNISADSSEETVKQFFVFCGKIQDFELLMDEDQLHQTALIHFERESAAKTAILLSNALIDDSHIVATPYFETNARDEEGTASDSETTVSNDGTSASSSGVSTPRHQETKAKTRIVAEILANGYILQDQIVAKGLEYDTKYSLTSRFTNYLQTLTTNVKQMDEKYRIWDKAVEIDNKYKIHEKVQTAAQQAQSTATAALHTPTGQKVERLAYQTLAQIAAVHYEAKKIQMEKQQQQVTSTASTASTTPVTSATAVPVA